MRHVAIIGGGPAGAMAAVLLARRGWSVRLAEQHRYPRPKVCGECLSALGIEVLDRVGIRAAAEALGPVSLTHVALHPLTGPSVRLRLPRPMWGISRDAFDAFLLNEAARAGASVHQPARVERFMSGGAADDRHSPRPAIQVRDLVSNRVETWSADHIIVADGKGARLGRRHRPTGDLGLKAHFVNVNGPADSIELFGCRGLYGGLAAIQGGRWNAAFSVPAERLRRAGGDVEAVFEQVVREHPVLRERLRGACRVGGFLTSPLPRFAVARPTWGRTTVGNAAAALEPIGGEGMGLALRSAELAAEAIDRLDLHRADEPVAALYRAFGRLWRIRRASCRAAALVVSRPAAARALIPTLSRFHAPAALALSLMGKSPIGRGSHYLGS